MGSDWSSVELAKWHSNFDIWHCYTPTLIDFGSRHGLVGLGDCSCNCVAHLLPDLPVLLCVLSIMASTLVFAMTTRGARAFEVPCGARIDLTPPIDPDQFSQWDITGNEAKMKSLMKEMDIKDVRDLFVKWGADADDIPKKMKKEALISQFVKRWEKTRTIFEELVVNRPSSPAGASSSDDDDGGRRVAVVQGLDTDMTNAEVIAEVRRQVPEFVNVPDRVVQRYIEQATRIGEDGVPRPNIQQEPQEPAPVPKTEAFSGRGYKLGEESSDPDYEREHVKPDMEFRMLPYENAPKDTYTVKEGMGSGGTYDVILTETSPTTKGEIVVLLECQKCTLRLRYHYEEKDTIRDLLELLEANTNFAREDMVLYYKGGKSYFHEYEPIWASVLKQDGANEFKLCIRAKGGAKGHQQKAVKKNMTKSEKLDYARKMAQQVLQHEGKCLACLQQVDKKMADFTKMIAEDPKNAFDKMMADLAEKNLEDILAILNSNHNVEYRMKQMAHRLFGDAMIATKNLHEITAGVLDTAELSVITTIEASRETSVPINLPYLRTVALKHLNQKIGAREGAMRD